jgi:hypothetical protein
LSHLNNLLILISTSLASDLRYFAILVLSLVSNICDAVAYLQTVSFKNKETAEYYAALFYFCGLSVSLTKHLQRLLLTPKEEEDGKEREGKEKAGRSKFLFRR